MGSGGEWEEVGCGWCVFCGRVSYSAAAAAAAAADAAAACVWLIDSAWAAPRDCRRAVGLQPGGGTRLRGRQRTVGVDQELGAGPCWAAVVVLRGDGGGGRNGRAAVQRGES